jgi:hypothetical protein
MQLNKNDIILLQEEARTLTEEEEQLVNLITEILVEKTINEKSDQIPAFQQ